MSFVGRVHPTMHFSSNEVIAKSKKIESKCLAVVLKNAWLSPPSTNHHCSSHLRILHLHHHHSNLQSCLRFVKRNPSCCCLTGCCWFGCQSPWSYFTKCSEVCLLTHSSLLHAVSRSPICCLNGYCCIGCQSILFTLRKVSKSLPIPASSILRISSMLRSATMLRASPLLPSVIIVVGLVVALGKS